LCTARTRSRSCSRGSSLLSGNALFSAAISFNCRPRAQRRAPGRVRKAAAAGSASVCAPACATPEVASARGSFVALPNLLLGRGVVPELLFRACTPTALAAAARRLCPDQIRCSDGCAMVCLPLASVADRTVLERSRLLEEGGLVRAQQEGYASAILAASPLPAGKPIWSREGGTSSGDDSANDPRLRHCAPSERAAKAIIDVHTSRCARA
jgi:hypothetical protein